MSQISTQFDCCDQYVVGQKVRITGDFRLGKTLTDPSLVKFIYQAPSDDNPTVWTHGTDVEVVKDATGKYYVDLPVDEAGTWLWRWESTGVVQSAQQGDFRVAAENPVG